MTAFEHLSIRVAASDLAALITHGADQADIAARLTRQHTEVRQEWDDAVTRLEGFRTTVAAMLGMSVLDDDIRLVEELRRRLTPPKPSWQCPACHEMVPGAELTCPACTGEHTQHQDSVSVGRLTDANPFLPADQAGPAEETGRFQPVPQPLDPGRDLEFWDNQQQDTGHQTPQHRCTAHGEQACGLCTLNPSTCNTPGEVGCATYSETGMHWDTCPNRVVTVTGAGAWILASNQVLSPAAPAHALTEDASPITPEILSDLLSLVEVTVSPDYIRDTWTPEQWEDAAMWASAVHRDASDNNDDVVPDRPDFVTDYVNGAPAHAK
jgi:hypothetical protein